MLLLVGAPENIHVIPKKNLLMKAAMVETGIIKEVRLGLAISAHVVGPTCALMSAPSLKKGICWPDMACLRPLAGPTVMQRQVKAHSTVNVGG